MYVCVCVCVCVCVYTGGSSAGGAGPTRGLQTASRYPTTTHSVLLADLGLTPGEICPVRLSGSQAVFG